MLGAERKTPQHVSQGGESGHIGNKALCSTVYIPTVTSARGSISDGWTVAVFHVLGSQQPKHVVKLSRITIPVTNLTL
jgi:hypothetical protein